MRPPPNIPCKLPHVLGTRTLTRPLALRPRLTNTQFSLEELRAIVEEAQAAGTYV
jgi:hypothetical protein